MLGIDISNHQAKIDLHKLEFDFVIIKLTEGRNFIDKSAEKFIEQAKSMNKLIGVYHFARPDLRIQKGENLINGMKEEARDFVKAMYDNDLLGTAIPFLDWEKDPFDDINAVMAFLELFESLTGIECGIYGSKSKLSKWNGTEILNRIVWQAYYKKVDMNKQFLALPTDVIYREDSEWDIWQYSNTNKLPNNWGNIDVNFSWLTKGEWLRYASGKPILDPYPRIENAIHKGIISEDERILFGNDNQLDIILKIIELNK